MIQADNFKIILLFSLIFLFIILLPVFLNNRQNKKSKSSFLERYYLADRKVSGIILAITLMSTYGSASTFLSGPGMAYKVGLGWVLLAVIQVTAGYFVLLVLARKFKKITKKLNSITITDYLKNRYQSKTLAYISTVCMILFLLAAMSGQWIGGAKLISAITGISYQGGILLISVLILFCVVFGGLRSILITDMIQGLIMIFATIFLFVALLNYGGGIESITNGLYNQNPNLLTPYGSDGKLTSIYVVSFWVLVGVGLVGLPQIAVNSMIYKNNRSLKQSIIIGTIVIFIVMFGIHFIGVMARGIFSDIKDFDSVVPIVSLRILPWYLVAFVLSAPMAAIITTVNAQFLLISSTLIKDLLMNINKVKSRLTERNTPKFVYVVNIFIVIFAMIIASSKPGLIIEINLFAMGGLESTFLWPIILGLYWKKAEKFGAISSVIVGVGSYIIFKNIFKIKMIEPVVLSLLLSFVIFVIISIFVYNRNIKN